MSIFGEQYLLNRPGSVNLRCSLPFPNQPFNPPQSYETYPAAFINLRHVLDLPALVLCIRLQDSDAQLIQPQIRCAFRNGSVAHYCDADAIAVGRGLDCEGVCHWSLVNAPLGVRDCGVGYLEDEMRALLDDAEDIVIEVGTAVDQS